MTYLCAGLYAEGRSDYELLVPLLDRVIPALAAEVLREVPIIGATIAIDAPAGMSRRREARIAASIHDAWEQCTFFGNSVSLRALRGLPAFHRFEEQLRQAITRAARP